MSQENQSPLVGEAQVVEPAKDNEAIREVLGKDDPFVKALDIENNPAIDLTKSHPCGCAGVIHEVSPECFLADFKAEMPEFWTSATQTLSMQYFYPFHEAVDERARSAVWDIAPTTPEQQAIREYALDHKLINPALKKFWGTFMPHMPQTGAVMIYAGLVNDTEVVYIRYEQDHVKPMTFVLARAELSYFLRGWTEAISDEHRQTEMEDWCKHPTEYGDLKKKGYRYNLSALAITFPLNWFFHDSFGINVQQFRGMVTGDFDTLEDIKKELSHRFDRYVADITRFAVTLKDKVKFKDHNLMLAFKATDDFKGLVVSLDKIYPKFPEGGQYECGESLVKLEDWAGEGDNTKVVIRKLIRLTSKVNEMFDKLYTKLPDNDWCRSLLGRLIKERLIASSHFLKELYQANPTDIRPYVEEMGNKVLAALNERGGNIGLDLTSWVVYQYFEDGKPPVPVVADGLNFKQELYNQHTERFMEVLYQYLYHVRSPYIRPYVHKVVADKNDGIPVGSIRPVNKEE